MIENLLSYNKKRVHKRYKRSRERAEKVKVIPLQDRLWSRGWVEV